MDGNIVDNYGHINEYIFYTPVSIPGRGCDLNDFESQISACCDCENECNDINKCSCLKKFGKNYENKKLTPEKLFKDSYITECNSQCSCAVNKCENKLVQFGPFPFLKLKYFEGKNYGLVTEKAINKGEFICEYAGEVINKEEAIARSKGDNANYIFMLNEYTDDKIHELIIDATCIANIGRYINHSCDPNCTVTTVRINSIVPKLAIFALKDINVDEEITYSYSGLNFGTESSNFNNKLKSCLCGSDKCLKYLPYEP